MRRVLPPRVRTKNAVDFGFSRQRVEQRLHEPQAHNPRGTEELERRNLDLRGAYLAVSDFAVAGELHSGDSIIDDLHMISI
jgi:hypothetical protein